MVQQTNMCLWDFYKTLYWENLLSSRQNRISPFEYHGLKCLEVQLYSESVTLVIEMQYAVKT